MNSQLLIPGGASASNWRFPEQKKYTQKDLFSKYMEGVSDGEKKAHKTIKKQLESLFQENIDKAQKLGEQAHIALNEMGIRVSMSHMKIEPLSQFKILLQVNADDFNSEKIIDGYQLLAEIEEENNSDDFFIDFSFLPKRGTVNDDCLFSDGFLFYYEQPQSS